KSGAADFVLKHHLTTLPPAVHRAMRQVEFRAQRRRAEEALQSSEERYRNLVELSPDALFVQSDGKIVFINSAGVKLFAASDAEELVGQLALELVHPEDRRAIERSIRDAMEEHRPVPFAEARIIRRDAEVIDVEIAAAP